MIEYTYYVGIISLCNSSWLMSYPLQNYVFLPKKPIYHSTKGKRLFRTNHDYLN